MVLPWFLLLIFSVPGQGQRHVVVTKGTSGTVVLDKNFNFVPSILIVKYHIFAESVVRSSTDPQYPEIPVCQQGLISRDGLPLANHQMLSPPTCEDGHACELKLVVVPPSPTLCGELPEQVLMAAKEIDSRWSRDATSAGSKLALFDERVRSVFPSQLEDFCEGVLSVFLGRIASEPWQDYTPKTGPEAGLKMKKIEKTIESTYQVTVLAGKKVSLEVSDGRLGELLISVSLPVADDVTTFGFAMSLFDRLYLAATMMSLDVEAKVML